VHGRHDANGHASLRRGAAGHDPAGGGTAFHARCRTWPRGRAPWPHPLWTVRHMATIPSTKPAQPAMKDVEAKLARRQARRQGLFETSLLRTAAVQALVMLRPDIQWKNPVMFVVEVGTVLSIAYTIAKALDPTAYQAGLSYLIALDFWLLLTILFAN